MGRYTCRIWPILSFTEIPVYMEAMEARGLRFRRIRCFGLLAEYERVKPAETQYCQDYFEPELYRDIQPYLELCADSGWEIAWQFKKHKIFRRTENVASNAASGSISNAAENLTSNAAGGSTSNAAENLASNAAGGSTSNAADGSADSPVGDPAEGGAGRAVPVQSDEELSRENCRKASKSDELKNGLLPMLGCLLIWCVMLRNDEVYTSTWSLQLMILAPLAVFVGASLWYLRQWLVHTFTPGRRPNRLTTAWYGALSVGRVLTVIAIGVACAAAFVSSLTENGGNPFLAVLPGSVLLSLPTGRYQEQLKYSEGFPKGRRMEGVYWIDPKSCRRRRAAAWCLIVACGVAGLGFAYHYTQLEKPFRTSSFYCEEIYAENRKESAGRYYRARSEEYAETIANKIAHSAERWGGPKRVTEEEAELLRAERYVIGGHPLPEGGWDEAWRIFNGGGLVVVRKGEEVWYVME